MIQMRTAGRVVGMSLMAIGFLALPAVAQKPSPRLGPMAGMTFSNVTGEDADDFVSLTSFLVGGFAELPVSNVISIQPELLFRTKGFSQEMGADKLSLKASYFQVPLLLRANIPTSGNVRPHLYAGPALGFKMSCKITGNDSGQDIDEDCKDFDADTKGTETSLVFGGGLDIKNFTVGIRYDLGLSRVAEDDEEDSKLNSLAIYVGWGFVLRK